MRDDRSDWRGGAAAATISLSVLVSTATPAAAAGEATPSHPRHVQDGRMPRPARPTGTRRSKKQYDSWKKAYLRLRPARYLVIRHRRRAQQGTLVSRPRATAYEHRAADGRLRHRAPKPSSTGCGRWVQDHRDSKGMMQWELDGKSCKVRRSRHP